MTSGQVCPILVPMSTSLAAVREARGVSQPWLEKESGISERTIRRIETDPEYDPGFSTMLRLAVALGVSLDDLVVQDEIASTTNGSGRVVADAKNTQARSLSAKR